MKKPYFFLLLIFIFNYLKAQNPIVPAGIYIADPSTHVWKDDKMYVYGSRDESPDYYCSWTHHVLVSSDLKTWTIRKNSFASKGKDDQVSYSDDFLYAPDVQYSGGIYYLYYCLANCTRTEGVATSQSPEGPFLNGRVINTMGINEIDPCVFIDNDHCDPGVWNNHGSIVEFNNKWYVFYHRSTHGCYTMRKACVEPINFNADGSINEVEMTTQGAGDPLNAVQQVDAEKACLLYGNVRIQANASDNEELGGIRNDDKAAYKYIDFGEGIDHVSIRVAPGIKEYRIEVVLDHSWGSPVSVIQVPGKGNLTTWDTLNGTMKNIKGVHAVWLRFYGKGNDLCSVDWFRFGKTVK